MDFVFQMAPLETLCSLPANGLPVFWVPPNPDTRIHMYVAHVGGGPCQHLSGRERVKTVIEQKVPPTGSEDTWPVSSILQGCRFLLKVGDPLGHRDMSGQPPNMGPGCQGKEQEVNSQRAVMGDVVLTADFRRPQLLFLMISSHGTCHTQDLHSTSLAKRLDAGCFRFLFYSLSVYSN